MGNWFKLQDDLQITLNSSMNFLCIPLQRDVSIGWVPCCHCCGNMKGNSTFRFVDSQCKECIVNQSVNWCTSSRRTLSCSPFRFRTVSYVKIRRHCSYFEFIFLPHYTNSSVQGINTKLNHAKYVAVVLRLSTHIC